LDQQKICSENAQILMNIEDRRQKKREQNVIQIEEIVDFYSSMI
jgi:predicted nucleic acid-binding Zn ribbon protein